MFEFVIEHQFWTTVVIYWIFSAAVSSMPEPGANSNPGYLWLYRFLHSLAEFGRWCHVGFALDGAGRPERTTHHRRCRYRL